MFVKGDIDGDLPTTVSNMLSRKIAMNTTNSTSLRDERHLARHSVQSIAPTKSFTPMIAPRSTSVRKKEEKQLKNQQITIEDRVVSD